MIDIIENEIDKILEIYSQGDFYQVLISAKKDYTELTGLLDEEDGEYESRMNMFNEWYIFDYFTDKSQRIIDHYLAKNQIAGEVVKALKSVQLSLFDFKKINFRKQIVLKDILNDQKISLAKSQRHVGLLEADLFTARRMEYQGHNFLLRGRVTLPSAIKSVLTKESKKLRKNNDLAKSQDFLLRLEFLKTKYLRYKHIDPQKIFIFEA